MLFGKLKRIRQVLGGVAGREGFLRKNTRQQRFEAVIAERKTVARAALQRIEKDLAIHPCVACNRQCFGKSNDVLEQDHVVEDLDHLAIADAATMQHIRDKSIEQRFNSAEPPFVAADHDGQRALFSGLPGAGHRRVGIGDAFCSGLLGQFAAERDRRR